MFFIISIIFFKFSILFSFIILSNILKDILYIFLETFILSSSFSFNLKIMILLLNHLKYLANKYHLFYLINYLNFQKDNKNSFLIFFLN